MREIVIVGCGGFGREVHDVIDAINAVEPTWVVRGYVDDAPSPENLALVRKRDFEVIGSVDDALSGEPAYYTIGIGAPAIREKIDRRFQEHNWEAATLVHPSVTMGFDVQIGEGSVICAGSRLTTNIRLGRLTHINPNCNIGHDVVFGDYVSVNPIVAISGWVNAADRVMFGTHSAILQNLSVGEDAVIGGGALVVKDVMAGQTVKGVPAR